MKFHFTDCEKILFNGWNTNELWKFVLSVIGIFLIAILYEGFRLFREILRLNQIKKEANSSNPEEKTFKEAAFTKQHGIQTLLHFIQLTVGYCLMLVAMTFNGWLFLAIVLGSGLGYFSLDWIRQKHIENQTCCSK